MRIDELQSRAPPKASLSLMNQVDGDSSLAVPRLESSKSAGEFAADLIQSWPRETPFDAERVLSENPELNHFKSVVIDLAYEEYCRHMDAGGQVSPEEFAERFPLVKRSLVRLLEVDQFLDRTSAFAPDPATLPWPEIGDTFLEFKLVEGLGRGAFSRVFLAQELLLGKRLVVVKICYRGGHEADLLGQLDHPHIMPIHSVHEDTESGLTAICMPFLGRATLADVLDAVGSEPALLGQPTTLQKVVRRANYDEAATDSATAMPVRAARRTYLDGILELTAQLAEGLAYTHEAGIFHRDIKPSNVLLTSAGNAVLLDFNLSSTELRDNWTVAGTLAYMAPEQLRALVQPAAEKSAPPDSRTDLFQLGVLLHELLTGDLPFGSIGSKSAPPRDIAADLLERQRRGPQSARKANATIDPTLDRLIASCLAYEPANRPASARALATALRSHLSLPRRLVRWSRIHPRAATAWLAAILLLLGSTGYAFASLAPNHLREWERGRAAQARGDHSAAVRHFSRALRVDPDDSEARFARGRSYIGSQKYAQAYEDFKWLDDRKTPDGRIPASMGYCLSHMDNFVGPANLLFERALQQGFVTPIVYNNLGYCETQINELQDARKHLELALDADPNLQAAYHNLAIVDLVAAVKERKFPDPVYVRTALELGPRTAELEFDAACVEALLSDRTSATDPSAGRTHLTAALNHAGRAVTLGLDSKELQKLESLCPSLKSEPDYTRLREIAAGRPSAPPRLRSRILDPLLGNADKPLARAD